MIAYLDGIPVVNMTDSMKKPKFTIRRQNESGDKAIGFTGDLLFTGTDYDYVYTKLVTDTNAVNNTVEFKLVDECCGNKTWTFLIKPENLRWCQGECIIKANATEFTENSRAYDCVKNTLIYHNDFGFQSQPHPKMQYCIEYRPAILQDVILCFGVLISIILVLLYPVVAVVMVIVTIVNAIIAAVNTLPGVSIDPIDFDGDSSTNTLEEYTAFRDRVQQFLVGCGRKHPSPLVRSYVKNVCQKCGLNFVSSIYNNPASSRYNTVYFNAPVRKGNDPADNSNWIDDNKPLLNGKRFFDEIVQPINGKWKIVGNDLIIERHDFFSSGALWVDVTTLDPAVVKSECYQWSRRKRYAYANLQYSKDAIDWVGNEALARWNDIVEWNSPPSLTQKDEYLVTLPYGAARFRDDKIDRDVLSDYEGAPFLGSTIAAHKRVLIMNNGTSFTPKLLIWDGEDINYSKTATGYGGTGSTPAESYNYPWWIDSTHSGNAYDAFWYINNPRVTTFVGQEAEVELVMSCDLLSNIDTAIDKLFRVTNGDAETEQIEVDYATKTIKFSGEL